MQKIIMLFMGLFLSVMLLPGCGIAKDNVEKLVQESGEVFTEAIENEISEIENAEAELEKANLEQEKADAVSVNSNLKEIAKKEGMSVKELEVMLDELTQLGADKYGISKEEYVKQIEAGGNTVLSEWQVAADYMGVSITELYEYEKVSNLTDEQKEVMQGMNDALDLAEAELNNMVENDGADIEALIGIGGNESGEIQVVTMDDEELIKAFNYKTYKVTQDYVDEYSIVFEYVSDADIDDLATYYKNLIVDTEEYMSIGTPESLVVMYQGMINETMVYIEINQSQGGMPTVATYIDVSSRR